MESLAHGKSSVADSVAKRLGIVHINTGSMYRAVTYYFIKNNIEISVENVLKELDNINLVLKNEDGIDKVYLNGEDVTKYLRLEIVSNNVAVVAAIKEVRKKIVEIQRNLAKNISLIMEGRDIGSVVLPNADLKLFLVTDVHKRAQRRQKDLLKQGEDVSIEKIEEELNERDRLDMTREVSPLIKTEDSIEIDTSETTVEQVTDRVVEILKSKNLI